MDVTMRSPGPAPEERRMTVTVELARQYEEDGYIVVENLFSREEIDRLGRRIDEVCAGKTDFPDREIEWEPGTTDAGVPRLAT